MRCAICEREFDPTTAPPSALPFCSARCKQIDLARWLGGRYTLPGVPQPEGVDPDAESDT